MTAVPPPVPPEIVRRAAEALHVAAYDADERSGRTEAMTYALAETVLAAVYGDIVEAARRDAADALEAKAPHIHRDDLERAMCVDGCAWLHYAATLLRVATAPPHAPTATVGDEQAVPRTPGTDGAQKRSQRDEDGDR